MIHTVRSALFLTLSNFAEYPQRTTTKKNEIKKRKQTRITERKSRVVAGRQLPCCLDVPNSRR